MFDDIVTTPKPQFQSPSVIPNLLEDLHQAAMFAGQSHLHLCRARRSARNTQARRVLSSLIAGQQQAIKSVQRLRNGEEGAL
jgi:hypothetical protein